MKTIHGQTKMLFFVSECGRRTRSTAEGGATTRTRTNFTEGRSALRLDESTGGLSLWPALDLGFNNEIHKELLFYEMYQRRCRFNKQ